MKRFFSIAITLFLLNCFQAFSGTGNIDSLKRLLPGTIDTSRVNLLNRLSLTSMIQGDFDGAVGFAKQAEGLADSLDFSKGLIQALNNQGEALYNQDNYKEALEYHEKALALSLPIGNKRLTASIYSHLADVYLFQESYDKAITNYEKCLQLLRETADEKLLQDPLNNIATAYFYSGQYEKALEYYLRALTLEERYNNKSNMQSTLVGIGNVYTYKSDFINAVKYYQDALKVSRELNDTDMTAQVLNNIGNALRKQKKDEEALNYFLESLELKKKSGNKAATVNQVMNIGLIYMRMGDDLKALDFFSNALDINKETGNKKGMASCYTNMGLVYGKQKNYSKAIQWMEKGLELANEINSKELIKSSYEELAEIHAAAGHHKEAYEYHKLYATIKDTLLNEQNSKSIVEMQTKYQTEKQQMQIEQLNQEKERERLVRNVILVGSALVLILAIVAFNSYLQKRKANKALEEKNSSINKQKEIIEQQKSLVEYKNKEITDSINYAKRIQDAIIPSQKYIRQLLSDCFVLFQPKDIVSGDFYWFSEKDNRILFAAVDCTGHGVPGAFMSMIGNNLLNEIVNEKGITQPSDVLDALNNGVRIALKQNTAESDTRDGMDIALCMLDKQTKTLHYSGANRPLYYFRNNELTETKANKFAIGGLQTEGERKFTNHTISYQPGDMIYIFSDGYADQFGGPEGKKFMGKQMKELLHRVLPYPVEQQHQTLAHTINNWRGSLEQIDDILVIGVRL